MELDITILEKLKGLLSRVLGIENRVSLFVVIQRENLDTWDLVFAGNNIRTKENLDAILRQVRTIFEGDELLKFPRLILLDSDNNFVKGINRAFAIDGGTIRIKNSQIDDVFIKDAYLLYSKKSVLESRKDQEIQPKEGVKIKSSVTSASGKVNINELTKNHEK